MNDSFLFSSFFGLARHVKHYHHDYHGYYYILYAHTFRSNVTIIIIIHNNNRAKFKRKTHILLLYKTFLSGSNGV